MFYTENTVPLIVIGCVVVVVLVSLIIGLICCWMIKRQRKLKAKSKELAETDENLLSFTSYCVVDKNPLPKSQFDQLL
jgi:hypothetical protein